jgi:hypothetical protein
MALAIFILLGSLLYPALVVSSHKIGDDLNTPDKIQQEWSSRWAGVASILLTEELDVHNWAIGVESWKPQARLSYMPAYQASMADAIGQFSGLVGTQIGGEAEADLLIVERLLTSNVGVDEVRAAREALASYNGAIRLHHYNDSLSADRYIERVKLMRSWVFEGMFALEAVLDRSDTSVLDKQATEGVALARAKAYVAHRLLSYIDAPIGLSTRREHQNAIAGLEAVVKFDPSLVLNGKPDGLLIPSHPSALLVKLNEAQLALKNLSDAAEMQMSDTAE